MPHNSEILITGGAGFIGSHIQDRLIESGSHVTVVDSLRSGNKHNLHKTASFYQVDIRDRDKFAAVVEATKPKVIIHTAAQNQVPYSMKHPYEDQDINILGMMNVLEAARENGVKKVIYTNTGGALYGEVTEDKLPIVEDEPIIKPSSFYGVSKMAGESYLKLYGNVYDVPWVSLRLANIYGPRQDPSGEAGIIAIFADKMLKGQNPVIFGDGGHTRDYVYVDDLVDAVVKAVDHPNPDYFNISSGQETSNLVIFETIKQATGSSFEPQFGPERPGDVRRNSLSNRKAEELLGWVPKTDFPTGIQQTVFSYKGSN